MRNIYLLTTVCFTVYFQLMLKWRMSKLGALPDLWYEKLFHVLKAFFDPFIISAFAAGVLASIFWMATLSKFELSTVYPIFLSLSIVLIVTLSGLLLNEPLTIAKFIGVFLIFSGLWFVNQH